MFWCVCVGRYGLVFLYNHGVAWFQVSVGAVVQLHQVNYGHVVFARNLVHGFAGLHGVAKTGFAAVPETCSSWPIAMPLPCKLFSACNSAGVTL